MNIEFTGYVNRSKSKTLFIVLIFLMVICVFYYTIKVEYGQQQLWPTLDTKNGTVKRISTSRPFYRRLNSPDKDTQTIRLYTTGNSSFKPFSKSYQLNSSSRITSKTLEEVNLNGWSQKDPRILNYIREHHLIPPNTGGYHFDKYPLRDGKDAISPVVAMLLKHKKNGFYIECGANDGEFLSNTLTLEINYGWTGLLIEADPRPLKKLISRNRKAWIANVCLAVKPFPHKVPMVRIADWSPMSTVLTPNSKMKYKKKDLFRAQCFPFISVLAAMNVTVVDYMSLDVEGVELDILKTLPLVGKDMIIKVISVEANGGKGLAIIKFMLSNGYKKVAYIESEYTHDVIFVRKDVSPSEIDVAGVEQMLFKTRGKII